MEVDLNYGRGMLRVRLPENADVTVIRKPDMPVLPDPEGAVTETVTRTVPPAAALTVPTLQLTVPEEAPTAGVVQVAPGAITDWKVVPAGSGCWTTTFPAAPGPEFT